MIDSNQRSYSVANTQLRRSAITSTISGAVFIPIGWYFRMDENGMPGVLFMALGVILMLRGILTYTKAARYPEA